MRHPQRLYLKQAVRSVTVSWLDQGGQVQTMEPSPIDYL